MFVYGLIHDGIGQRIGGYSNTATNRYVKPIFLIELHFDLDMMYQFNNIKILNDVDELIKNINQKMLLDTSNNRYLEDTKIKSINL